MGTTIAPLPSFIRASATDAANMQMRKAGRTKWNDDDWNRCCEVQDRLVRSCYSRHAHNDPAMPFFRFQIAERLERAGLINSDSDIAAAVDAAMGVS